MLGTHVNQAGSLVEPDRLRFDFSHFGSISSEELQDVEQRVNLKFGITRMLIFHSKQSQMRKQWELWHCSARSTVISYALYKLAITALELCGGCHVQNTGQIGLFKIVSESGIGSGVRRIEAVSGRSAYEYLDEQLQLLKEAAGLLKSNIQDVPKRVDATLAAIERTGT